MSARVTHVMRGMSLAKVSVLVFVTLALLTTVFMLKMTQGQAAPGSATDQTAVPHYFGPYSNWALSQLTLPDATVTINGDGVGATATATVGANGKITGIDVTDPGSGYTAAATTVSITGAGTSATATADVTTIGGAVNNVDVPAGQGGVGYVQPVVTFTGGGATKQATGTAYGSVDTVTLTSPGTSGYQFPTVDFDMPDDPNGTIATGHLTTDGAGGLTGVVIDDPGSGYASAPSVVIRDGTILDPINTGGSGATAKATIGVDTVAVDNVGAGYTSVPTVTITDSKGTPTTSAVARATIAGGVISKITVDTGNAGSGYITPGGIRKFQDDLPMLCDPSVAGSCPAWTTDPATGAQIIPKYIPLAVPEVKTYHEPDGQTITSDVYQIAVVQYRTNFSSSLGQTLARGYVQLETPANASISQHYPLTNANLDPALPDDPILDSQGNQVYAVTPPQWLGPFMVAQKNVPVRVALHNLLPTGGAGNLFLPTDTTMMGSGMGPMAGMMDPVDQGTVLDDVRNPVCTDTPQDPSCFQQNRAVLHLHGGLTPWISDGTPHQWITPANDSTSWPKGQDAQNVPDMWFDASGSEVMSADGKAPTDTTNDPGAGVATYYYTNQQSARVLWIHDHSWGITRLNVLAGEALGYVIQDGTEKKLVDSGAIPGPADTIPLVVQDRTFVPKSTQMYDVDINGKQPGDVGYDATKIASYGQDPTWNAKLWGGEGSFWYHHVYMPAQNPGDPSGQSAYGRWMYGPWFWPPASDMKYGPIANPRYDPACDLNDTTTWTYKVSPYCEPELIPGTPNVSVGMEQYNDTPMVNGVAYPTVTLQPKSYRLRLLNAANDRFFNFQWYVAEAGTASTALNVNGAPIGGTEVTLDPTLLAQAQTDPIVYPTPVIDATTAGPDWIQIGSEGGFLPAPTVVPGQQPMTFITDPSRFDFGNGDKHALLLAPAERADVIVDFSQYAGQTLILYNDAVAPFPARAPYYDYYTGAPDMSPMGAPTILPGFGPNSRTVMQVKIAAATPATAFDLSKLRNAFSHKANGSGVFESGQAPIVVAQAAYNSAYGTSFSPTGDCNAAGSTLQVCDGLVRVDNTTLFGFNTLKHPKTKTVIAMHSKAMHDEMNSTVYDDFGRMQATMGVEVQPPTPMNQNVVLYPFVNPGTEFIDGTSLPTSKVSYDVNGDPVGDIQMSPMSDAGDGTQIWRITHNGVDTHPIHFHLFDVQVVNRVTWDNIVIPADPNELGWKETVRMSPLEDTIVALRPLVPPVPFELPNAIRYQNPMMPEGSQAMFSNIDINGIPTNPVVNKLVNFADQYMWHCHILSHEEMDMMRPLSLVMPPNKADGLGFALDMSHVVLTWNDNSINETSFLVERTTNGTTWQIAGTVDSPLALDNTHGTRTFTDPAVYNPRLVYQYRVSAQNTAGYGAEFPTMTAQSVSDVLQTGTPPLAPTVLAATPQTGPQVALSFTDNATDEAGFTLQRSDNGGTWATLASLPADTAADPTKTGTVTYTDATVAVGTSYDYRVRSDRGAASSTWSNTAGAVIPAVPNAPTGLAVALQNGPQGALSWTDVATNEDSYVVERAVSGSPAFALVAVLPANATTWNDFAVLAGVAYDYRVAAVNLISGKSLYSNTATLSVPGSPWAPTSLAAVIQAGPKVSVTWADNASNETGFTVQRSDSGGAYTTVATLPANTASFTDIRVFVGGSYAYQVCAFNQTGASPWAGPATVGLFLPAAPSGLAATVSRTAAGPDTVTLNWVDNASNETGFTIQRATNAAFTANLITYSVAANVTTYSNAVAHGQTYYYRVRAANVLGASGWSNTATVTTVPMTPGGFRSTKQTRTAISLAWTDLSANETGYQIQIRRAGVATWSSAVTTAPNATSYVDTALARNTTYIYRIRGANAVGKSPWAPTVRVSTLP